MWVYNSDYGKWLSSDDSLKKIDFDYLKQELSSVRFYSKCLSGATYLPINNLNNIYDILGEYEPRNWYMSVLGSEYSNSLIPSQNATPITSTSSYDYYNKYISEYGLTLKNLFTPDRIIKDSVNNYIYVDIATIGQLDDLTQSVVNRTIDGVRVLEGHRVLIKDQVSTIVLANTIDPSSYFEGNYRISQNLGATIEYEYFNNENGIYIYKNNKLIKESDLDDYDSCIRFSVAVKLGSINNDKQFHLSRLLNGYYPTSFLDQPMEFIEKHNWLLRNKVDYNNLFEINYFDIIKHATQSYTLNGIMYNIPERTISVGEFGVILNHQEGISNLIRNKYKVILRSISQTLTHYWICGDDGMLLKVRKHDFDIERVKVDCNCPRNIITTGLKSISFYDSLKGVAVGDLNTVLVTDDGGFNWSKITITGFNPYYYNKVFYSSPNSFFVAGNTGIFIEYRKDIYGWTAYKRRISKLLDSDDEYLLVDNINDIFYTNINTWGLNYTYGSQSISSTKELLFIVTDDSKIIVHDINQSIGVDFLYLDFPTNYSDIRNIIRHENTNIFYFTGMNEQSGESGLFSFDITNFQSIGIGNSYSNTINSTYSATFESTYYANELYDYNGTELLICGNESLLQVMTYSSSFNILDPLFESRLKSKLLFLDYDIASKLNFFTDFGDYRLPNPISFTFSLFSNLLLKPLSIGSQSENNWFTYWQDRQMTFEYYDSISPMTEISKVLISSEFKYSLNNNLVINSKTNNISDILPLAPSINDKEHSRFNAVGLVPISLPPDYDLYLYDYLMVIKAPFSFDIDKGDILRFDSEIVTGNFIINKIVSSTSSSTNYLYMFSEFNQNIITEIINSTASVMFTNLNKYTNNIELSNHFNLHPLSNGYEMSYLTASNSINIEAKFNNLTSYYNMAMDIVDQSATHSMAYNDSFLNFGYSPTYNILDYLKSINESSDPNPTFYSDKEYYAMPDYRSLSMPGLSSFTSNTVYIDYNFEGNKIIFGSELKLEWESIFINTFIDINLYDTNSYITPSTTTERLLVLNKFHNPINDTYVIEFHKKINYVLSNELYYIDIISRRKLYQISEDLQYMNNIQRSKSDVSYLSGDSNTSPIQLWGVDYKKYEKDLNFKIPTDSYAKILLSDSPTLESLSGILYVDFKNELALNITRLESEKNIPILTTANFNDNLFIYCSIKHELKTGDGIVIEFNGGTGSSEELNTQYFGYHTITVQNEYNVIINVPFGVSPLVGNDTGFIRYVKNDPFLNYQPVDIIDIGIDKKGKRSVELTIENIKLSSNNYSLENVDFNNYRFRLVDGLNIESLAIQYPWIYEAEISNAVIGLNNKNELTWYSGTWEGGRWFGGNWISGTWVSGDWYDGTWNSKSIKDNYINVEVDDKSSDVLQSTWINGRWYGGVWNNGTWINGRWYGGVWNNGSWYKGIWNDGIWNDGKFNGGIWVLGTWNNGVFNTDNEPSYWLDGKWYGGDFENGMWYNGTFEEKNAQSRFGVNAYNSRTATWHAGKWVSGSFHSRLNLNDNDEYDVSDVHKYSIWKTGSWFSGDFYGGVVYNMDFRSGTWHGGILDDIQIIGFTGSSTTSENYFTLNGIFKFNTGDEFSIIDNQVGNTYSVFGSNDNPIKYKVLDILEDNVNKWTNVYVDRFISYNVTPPIDLGIRIVSRFRSCNWKSGIWTNGLYESGLWEGGIWYNGVFNATWM